MRKQIFLLGLALIVLGACVMDTPAKSNNDLNGAISMYKAGNYSGCIQTLEGVLKDDPSNAAAHYYMAIANAQSGRTEEAISHYDTVIRLNTQETLVRYAVRGKLCLEDAEKCSTNYSLDEFIRSRNGFDVTNSVKSTIETQNLNSIMRDINDNKEIDKKRLKQYKDFSSMNNETPSNDEIVAALRTLQRAGISAPIINNQPSYSDLGALYAGNYSNNTSSMDNLVNIMSRLGSNSSNSNIDPRVLQTIMTSQLTSGF